MGKLITVEGTSPALEADELTYMRYGKLGEGFIATSESGSWHHFSQEEFSTFLAGELPADDELTSALIRKGFLRQGYDLEFHSRKFRSLKRYLGAGVARHYIALDGPAGDLETDVAKAIVDQIITCASDDLQMVFIDGGNGIRTGILEFIKDYAKEKNQYEGKELTFSLRSPLSKFGSEEADWLIANGFALETHLDATEEIHEANRESTGAGRYKDVLQGLATYIEAGKSAQKERHEINTLITTKLTPDVDAKALVAGFQEAGVREFRVLPIGMNEDVSAYVEVYTALVNALMEVESGTPRVRELGVSALLQRIHKGLETDDGALQSPTSAGLSELCYDTAGHIFPNEEAKALFEDGDPMFLLGKAGEVDPKEVRKSHTVRALTIASIGDCLPAYQHLWSAPYLGLDPVHAYAEHGDLFPCFYRDSRTQARHGVISSLFEMLVERGADDDGIFMQLSGTGDDGI